MGLAATPAILLHGLSKQFGAKLAVGGIDLDVPAGSFFGLVGPNGAGKTTTLSMITGLLRPDSGQIVIQGCDVWSDPTAVKALIGVVPDGLRLFDRLSGPELLTFTGRLRGLPPAVIAERSAQLLATFGLTEAGRTLVIDYSTGMRKKISLAAALLHDPQVLILDEPFEGVDPLSAKTIRGVLQRYVDRGATVVFSSHAMDIVARLCDHLAVMAHGTVRAAGPIQDVLAGRTVEEAFFELVGGTDPDREDLSWLGSSAS
jgi:ABC-2 type transport system ATP-binding protein